MLPFFFASSRRTAFVAAVVAIAGLISAPILSAQAVYYQDWRQAEFDPADWHADALSGPVADPDSDGQTNLQEFVFVGDPWSSADGALIVPQSAVIGDALTLTYRERHDLAGVKINLQGSSTLMDWVTFNGEVEVGRQSFVSFDEVTLVDPVQLEPGERRFLRLSVNLTQSESLRAPSKGSFEVLSPNQWRVRWTDNNTEETGHAVERLRGLYSWEEVGATGADQSNWIHDGANHQISFTYRVVAQGVDGAMAASEPFSLTDTDGDLIPDVFEKGASYTGETGTYPTYANQFSSNGSGVSDGWLTKNGYDPMAPFDGSFDSDGDGISDQEEYLRGTGPHNADSDGDGVSDGEDGWPRHDWITIPPLPDVQYAVVQLLQTGWPSNAVARRVSDQGDVAGYQEIANTYDTHWIVLLAGESQTAPVMGWWDTPLEQIDMDAFSAVLGPVTPYEGYPANYPDSPYGFAGFLFENLEYSLPNFGADSRLATARWNGMTLEGVVVGRRGDTEVFGPLADNGFPSGGTHELYACAAVLANRLGDVVTVEWGGWNNYGVPDGYEKEAFVSYLRRGDGSNTRIGDTYYSDNYGLINEGGATLVPYAINDDGYVVGKVVSAVLGGVDSAADLAVWSDGELHTIVGLNRLIGLVSSKAGGGALVAGNNLHNDLVWASREISGEWVTRPFDIWEPSIQAELGVLHGGSRLNERLELVADTRLVRNGEVCDIVDLLPTGWSAPHAIDINNYGVILAGATRTLDDNGAPITNPQSVPVLLIPVELDSRDRLVKGSITIPEGWTNVSLRLRNRDTQQDLGVFAQLEPGVEDGSTYIYDNPEGMFSEGEFDEVEAGTIDPRALNQAVTFYRDAEDPRRLHFTTVFDDVGDIELELSFGSGEAPAVAKLSHILTADADMAALIDTVDQRIETLDTPGVVDFDLDTDGDGIPDGGGADLIVASQPGMAGSPGPFIAESSEDDPLNLILLANTDDDDADGIADWMFGLVSPDDDDLSTIILKRPVGLVGNSGTFTLTLTGGASIRLRTASGQTVTGGTTVNLTSPSGPLAGLATGSVTLYLDGVAPATSSVTLTYDDPATSTTIADSVHLTVLDPAQFAAHRARHYLRPATSDLHGLTLRIYAANGSYVERRHSLGPIGENPPLQNPGLVAKTLHFTIGGPRELLAFFRGLGTGFAMGIHDDGEFVGEVISYLAIYDNRWDRAKAMFDPFFELYDVFKGKSASEITAIITAIPQTLWQGLYEEAESELGWEPLYVGIDPSVFAYMRGMATGYLGEQVAVGLIPVGGVALRIGKTLPTVFREMATAIKTATHYVLPVLEDSARASLKLLPGLTRLTRSEEEAWAALQAVLKVKRVVFTGGERAIVILENFRKLRPLIYEDVLRIWADTLETLPAVSGERLTYLTNDLAALVHRYGEAVGDLPDDAVKGFAHMQGRLFQTGDDTISRWPDVEKLFGGLDNAAKKDALKESLIAYKQVVGVDPEAKFWVKGVSAIQETGYRYVTSLDLIKANSGIIPTHSGYGWYVSFDKFTDSMTAVSKLQLPPGSNARYRVEFDFSELGEKCRIPFSRQDSIKNTLEIVARDVTEFGGAGGGIQLLADGTPIPVKRVYLIENGVESLVDPTLWQ